MSNLNGDSGWEDPKNRDSSNSWKSQPINLRLQAAAPDLLEAVRRAATLLEWESNYIEGDILYHERVIVIQLAKAAITKATGEVK
jgi:hypothetical protein